MSIPFNELQKLMRCLGKIEGHLEKVTEQQERIYVRLDTTVVSVQKLKNKQAWFSGVVATLVVLVSALGLDSIAGRFF